MRIFNFGSVNIDYVYTADHIANEGETVACADFAVYPGGKGANQSIAIARAGGAVTHIGKIGRDGEWISKILKNDGVDITQLAVSEDLTGHAIVQVDKNGQNSIVCFGGTNRLITNAEIDDALENAIAGDLVLIQNEINNIPHIIDSSYEKGLTICFNPAPMDQEIPGYPLEKVSIFILNEVEGENLTSKKSPQEIIAAMREIYPNAQVVLTLGARGLLYNTNGCTHSISACPVDVVDTTGAGDTFIGYFLAGQQRGMPLYQSLEWANRAASVCVMRKGAANSIPWANELANLRQLSHR